jgi:hypothetical protein
VSDRILRLCLRAYPAPTRAQEGEILLGLARDLVADGSSPLRECAGLLAGGAAARAKLTRREVACAPWTTARSRLALPLAAALLAVVVGGAARASAGVSWLGWSWAMTLAGAACAVAGAAWGRRSLAVAGALALVSMLSLDAARDLHGTGSRWVAPLGVILVDVLVMWLPAALLLLVCAGSVRRPAGSTGVRRVTWAVLPAAALLLVAATRSAAVDPIVVYGAFAWTAAAVVVGAFRRGSDASATLAAAMVLAAATPSVLWLLAAVVPTTAAPLLYFLLSGGLASTVVLTLLRVAGRADAAR